MKSLLHCLWTGPTFPYSLRKFIKNWVAYFSSSKSEFELILWLTEDSFHALEEYLIQGVENSFDASRWSRCMPGIDVEFNRVSMNYNKFYIALVEPLLARYPTTLTSLFRILHENKRYTTVSNIGRVMLLDACGGIYTDIDYLNPNYQQRFPKNMKILMTVFNNYSRIGFYVSVRRHNNALLAENQCLILDPKKIGSLTILLRKIALKAASIMDKIAVESRNHMDFLENKRTIELSKSLFTSPEHNELAEAFKEKDVRHFNYVNAQIFKDERFQSEAYNYDNGKLESSRPLLVHGTLHNSYLITGKLTYNFVIDYYQENLKRYAVSSTIDFVYGVFFSFFNQRDIENQFEFKDTVTDSHVGMYSWANPGFSRLSTLKETILKMEERYIIKKN